MRAELRRLRENPVVRWALFVWGVISAIATLLGIPDVPKHVARLGGLVAWVDDAVARWALPGIGTSSLALIAVLWCWTDATAAEPRRTTNSRNALNAPVVAVAGGNSAR